MVHFFQGEAVRELHKHYHFVILNVSEESEYTPLHLQILRKAQNVP